MLSLEHTFSLKKDVDPGLPSLLAKCCGFICILDFFSGFFFLWYPVLCMSRRERKAFSRARVRNSQRALKLCCGMWDMSASLSYNRLFSFLFCALASAIFLSISGTQKNEETTKIHILLSIWSGFHFMRITGFGHLVVCSVFSNLIDSFFLLGKNLTLI